MQIDWGPHLAIGVQEIDAQHREIVRPLVALDAALARGDTGAVALTVQVVSRYVLYHFQTEEGWMRRTRYPRLREHMARHDALVAELVSLTYELGVDPDSRSMRRCAGNVVGLLQEHINVEDQLLAPHAAALPVIVPALTPVPGQLLTASR